MPAPMAAQSVVLVPVPEAEPAISGIVPGWTAPQCGVFPRT